MMLISRTRPPEIVSPATATTRPGGPTTKPGPPFTITGRPSGAKAGACRPSTAATAPAPTTGGRANGPRPPPSVRAQNDVGIQQRKERIEVAGTRRRQECVGDPPLDRAIGVRLRLGGLHAACREPSRLPVIELNGRRYVQSPFGEVNWVRNLRAAREAVVTKGGREVEVDAIEVAPEEGGPVLRDALAPYLKSGLLSVVLRRFFSFRTDSTLADYVAEARRHAQRRPPRHERPTGRWAAWRCRSP